MQSYRSEKDQLSKSQCNELAKWRLLTKILENKNSSSDEKKTINHTRSKVSELSEVDLVDLTNRLYEKHYSTKYIFSIWRSIQPLNALATKSLYLRTINRLTQQTQSLKRTSRKSDGRLTFSEHEFEKLRGNVLASLHRVLQIDVENAVLLRELDKKYRGDFREYCMFLYVFYMLSITGKRLSDLASINLLQLQQLSTRGVCVVRIRKTGGLGRIEIPDILAATKVIAHSDAKEAVLLILRGFVQWCKTGILLLPFDVRKHRRSLDYHLNRLYTTVCGVRKDRGLSFHALRRIYAGYRFLHGASVEQLRETLDHSNRRQTNRYVNNCLLELI